VVEEHERPDVACAQMRYSAADEKSTQIMHLRVYDDHVSSIHGTW